MSAGPDGVLVVDKPQGPTSHDIVRVARRALGTSRIGHTGTLDPLATGVLALVVGRATRLAQFMTSSEKVYVATLVFGRATTTYDADGETTIETGRCPAVEDVRAALEAMTGPLQQTPPVYSAKKIGGEVSHRLARRATPVALPPASVVLHEAEIEQVEGPAVRVRVRVSSGFYVRSLAHDLGERLGTGAHLGALRRNSSGAFSLDDAVAWEDLATRGRATAARLIGLERLLPHLACAALTDDEVTRIRHGLTVAAAVQTTEATEAGAVAAPGPVRLHDPQGRLVAIGAVVPAAAAGQDRAVLRPIVVLG